MRIPAHILGITSILIVGASANAATLSKKPYLIFAGQPGQMGIAFQTNAAPTTMTVTYGTTTAADEFTAPTPTLTTGYVYRTIMTNLPAGRIYYKVTVDGVTNTGSFLSPRGADANDITFYAFGDTRTNYTDFEAVASRMMTDVDADATKRGTFTLFAGDYCDDGDTESYWTSEFFRTSNTNVMKLLANLPLVGCVGNHEGSGALLKKYLPYPMWSGSNFYYSFDYGPVHVAVADSEIAASTVGSAQYNWLKADLEASKAPMKIVMWHSPAYSAGGGHSNNTALQSTFVDLCNKNGVQVVICGDNHYYARVLKTGTVGSTSYSVNHITTGGGGAPLYTPVTSTSGLQKSASALHFLRFEVTPSTGTGKASVYKDTGTLIETFTFNLNSYVVNAPTITTQPASATVNVGQTATFNVVASGSAPLAYQWKKNGTAISGATSASYVTPTTTTTDNGATFTVTVSNSAGSVTSNNATLTVNVVAPAITTQPANQTVTVGQTATFNVVATGTGPLSYQWKKNGVAIAGATSASYTTPATATTDSGATFTVTVTNSAGSVTSNSASLTVNQVAAPTITTQPVSKTVSVGQTATFTVVATGSNLTYQWKKNGVAIAGATAASYTTPVTTTADNGATFAVTVTNAAGSVNSSSATLTVTQTVPALTIATQPASKTVASGTSVTFSVAATGGTAPYKYQWYRGQSAIAGATSASYVFTAQTADNGATFKAIVTDSSSPVKTVTSGTATLTVTSSQQQTEKIVNGGFESSTTGWTGTTGAISNWSADNQPAFEGTRCAWLGGNGTKKTETLYQTVTIPSTATSATLSFALHIDTDETEAVAYDKLEVQVRNNTGAVLKTLDTYTNVHAASGYQIRTFDLSAYKGQTVRVFFNMNEDSYLQTSFVVDKVSLVVR